MFEAMLIADSLKHALVYCGALGIAGDVFPDRLDLFQKTTARGKSCGAVRASGPAGSETFTTPSKETHAHKQYSNKQHEQHKQHK